MSGLCCNHVAGNHATQKSEAGNLSGHSRNDVSALEHSPTHPHKHQLHVNDQIGSLTSTESENLRRCLNHVAAIPSSDLDNLKMPVITKV
jgi:hypothetical protein